jgi:hypothetical protein
MEKIKKAIGILFIEAIFTAVFVGIVIAMAAL